jgi:hypothetical protein
MRCVIKARRLSAMGTEVVIGLIGVCCVGIRASFP